jgi:hypothetical protein
MLCCAVCVDEGLGGEWGPVGRIYSIIINQYQPPPPNIKFSPHISPPPLYLIMYIHGPPPVQSPPPLLTPPPPPQQLRSP